MTMSATALVCDEGRLALPVFGAHLPRVARGSLGPAPLGVGRRHLDEPCAQRFHLLLDGGTHIEGFDNRSEPPRRGDRLKPGNPRPKDQHPGGLHRPCRRHEKRHETAVFVCCDQHGLVAGDIRLRRKDIHRLCPCDAGDGFERKGRHARFRELLDCRLVVRIEKPDENRPAPQQRKLARLGHAYFENDVGLRVQVRSVRDDHRAGGFEAGVRDARGGSGIRLNDAGMPAFSNQFADGLRCGSHARFAGPDFGWNADAHMDEGVSVAKILTHVSVYANSQRRQTRIRYVDIVV
jgi:hypothetical protein